MVLFPRRGRVHGGIDVRNVRALRSVCVSLFLLPLTGPSMREERRERAEEPELSEREFSVANVFDSKDVEAALALRRHSEHLGHKSELELAGVVAAFIGALRVAQ